MSAVVLVGGKVLGSGQLAYVISSSQLNLQGINIPASGGSTYVSEGLPMFNNQVRSGTAVTTFGGSTIVALNAAGWPNGSNSTFYQMLWQGSNLQSWMQQTIYCGYQSSGSETVSVAGGGTLTNTGTNGNGYKTFNITGATANCAIEFTGVTTAITNIYASITGSDPGQIDNPTQTSAYYAPWVTHYGQFGMLRWMWPSDAWYNQAAMTAATMNTPSNTQFNNWGFQSTTREGYPIAWNVAGSIAANANGYFCLPLHFDSTYLAAFVVALRPMVTANLKSYIEIGNELWGSNGAIYTFLKSQATAAGFATTAAGLGQYMGSLLHTVAVACRADSVIGPVFNTSVQLVLAWQAGFPNMSAFIAGAMQYISTTYYSGGLQQDIKWVAMSNYVNETTAGVGTSDSIATIESKMQAQSAVQITANTGENTAIQAMYYGAQILLYESAEVLNIGSFTSITSLPGAIVDSGWQAVVAAEKAANFNHGVMLDVHFEGGIQLDNAADPQWQEEYRYANLSTNPTLKALQQYLTYPTPTRNVIGAPGAGPFVILGGNCADTISGADPALETLFLAPYNGNEYQPWLIYSTTGGTYTLTVQVGSGTGTTNIGIGNAANGGSIPYTGQSLPLTSGVSITLAKGWNYVVLGNGSYQTVTIASLTFN
jgi:hypothetical protein